MLKMYSQHARLWRLKRVFAECEQDVFAMHRPNDPGGQQSWIS